MQKLREGCGCSIQGEGIGCKLLNISDYIQIIVGREPQNLRVYQITLVAARTGEELCRTVCRLRSLPTQSGAGGGRRMLSDFPRTGGEQLLICRHISVHYKTLQAVSTDVIALLTCTLEKCGGSISLVPHHNKPHRISSY